ncbi:MAG: transporter substrate-binding domain-containing protein [Gammaproteobacteria bacterium]|nr:transporter substrate-binding domain-containing protein [Gammaproteobacteria bacterium]MBU1489730.1 transporter substrate-binding domain-containing protein [Gammaproteobacteria bacterium]MBU2065076.1 transporter substrate-binding domain-containing protein [Gammaproteobacteria bacterium]MBU2137584.1 transporter substrate-binding domain-containing protein [Gammaproteobacteria bacterium]MBU2216464.1 transporter substrate-binding domain-containing protein [Gammaproteobacteria bacterium]
MKHSNTDCKPFGLLRKLALASCLLGASLSAHADLADIKAKGSMSVATEDDYAPFNFIVDGKPEGFHKELLEDLKAYAKEQGIEVKQEILPWTGLLASVSAGQYDMAFTGALVTDDRLRVFNFAPPFASAQHFYVKRAGDDSLGDIASLCGKTAGVQAGSALLARLPELKKMMAAEGCEIGDVIEYPSYPEAYADLANGRLDYVVNALISVNDLVKTRGDTFAKGIAVSGDGFAAWPVPKSSPELLEFLVGFMNQVRDNGRLAELQTKWFGEAFPSMPKEPISNVEQFHSLAGME